MRNVFFILLFSCPLLTQFLNATEQARLAWETQLIQAIIRQDLITTSSIIEARGLPPGAMATQIIQNTQQEIPLALCAAQLNHQQTIQLLLRKKLLMENDRRLHNGYIEAANKLTWTNYYGPEYEQRVAVLRPYLQLATMSNQKDCILPNFTGRLGQSLLLISAEFASLDLVQLLIQLGADPNYRSGDNTGPVPLHSVIMTQDVEVEITDARLAIIKILLENGAKPNLQTYQNQTPLYLLSRGDIYSENKKEAFRLLLTHGADPHITHFCGRAAAFNLMWGSKASNPNFISILKMLGK